MLTQRVGALCLVVAASFVAVALVPQDVHAQEPCFMCDGLTCDSDSEIGNNNPCDYTEVCEFGNCDWVCLLGGGGICEIHPEAVAMSGQVVFSDGAFPTDQLIDDAVAMVQRQKCNGIIVFTGQRRSAANEAAAPRPAVRITLK